MNNPNAPDWITPRRMGVASDMNADYVCNTLAELLASTNPFEGSRRYVLFSAIDATTAGFRGKEVKLRPLAQSLNAQMVPVPYAQWGSYASHWETTAATNVSAIQGTDYPTFTVNRPGIQGQGAKYTGFVFGTAVGDRKTGLAYKWQNADDTVVDAVLICKAVNDAADLGNPLNVWETLPGVTEFPKPIIDALFAAVAATGINRFATTADITAAIAGVIDAAPAAFDTLKELADYAAQDATGMAAMLATQQANTARIVALEAIRAGATAWVLGQPIAAGEFKFNSLAVLFYAKAAIASPQDEPFLSNSSTTTNSLYQLASVGAGPKNTDGLPEGPTNLYATEPRTLATKLAGYVKAAAIGAIAITDSILIALGLLEAKSDDNIRRIGILELAGGDLKDYRALRVTLARTRIYYSKISTTAGANDDAIRQALSDAQPGEFVYNTTPVILPLVNNGAVILPIPASVNLDLGGFSVSALGSCDAIGIMNGGTGAIIGKGSKITAEGTGTTCFYSSAAASANALYTLYDVNFVGSGSGCVVIRYGSFKHYGTIIANATNQRAGINSSVSASYELIGDLTVGQNGGAAQGMEASASGQITVRNSRIKIVTNAGARIGDVYNSGILRIGQSTIDLSVGPTNTGFRVMGGTTTAKIFLEDVTVLAGAIVQNANTSTIYLQGNTVLPAAYGTAYLKGLGMVVVDERPVFPVTVVNTLTATTTSNTDAASVTAVNAGIAASSGAGADVFLGNWNPNTNVPALAAGVGVKGTYYRVSVAQTRTTTFNTVATTAATTVTVNTVAGITVGQTIIGGTIPIGTIITAIDTATNILTLSVAVTLAANPPGLTNMSLAIFTAVAGVTIAPFELEAQIFYNGTAWIQRNTLYTVGNGLGSILARVKSGAIANISGGDSSVVSGGVENQSSGDQSTVSGGITNVASGVNSSVGGGRLNKADSYSTTIPGGQENTITGGLSYYTTIGGGFQNTIAAPFSVIGGGRNHSMQAADATIAGGRSNKATAGATNGTVGGGVSNQSQGNASTVSGGQGNIAAGQWSWIPGGLGNTTSGAGSSASGKSNNNAGVDSHIVNSLSCTIAAGCVRVMLIGCNGFTVSAGTDLIYIANVPYTAYAGQRAMYFESNSQSDYPLTLANAGLCTPFNVVVPVNVVIPNSSTVNFAVGTVIVLRQTNSGVISVIGAAGVNIYSFPGNARRTAGQSHAIQLHKEADNTWYIDFAVI